MRSCATALATSLIFCAAVTAGQSGPSASVVRGSTRSSVTEQVSITECDRMRWEAQQTWLTPTILGRGDHGNGHAVSHRLRESAGAHVAKAAARVAARFI